LLAGKRPNKSVVREVATAELALDDACIHDLAEFKLGRRSWQEWMSR
jgi:hypothetical protein